MSEENKEIELSKPCRVCETLTTIHLAFCYECEVCEKRFSKHDVQQWNLARKFLACEHCGLVESVSYYRLEAEKWHNAADTRLLKVNLFKSCMMNVGTMQALANDPTTDQPSVVAIRQRLQGIENFTLDEFQFYLEMYEIYAREIAKEYGKKASKEEIKKHLQDKTTNAIKEQQERVKKQEKKTTEQKTVARLTDEEKAIKGFMKSPGMTAKNAKSMYDAMMGSMKQMNEVKK